MCQGVGRRGWGARGMGSLVRQVSSTGEPHSAPRSPPCASHAPRSCCTRRPCHLSALLREHFSRPVSSRQESFAFFASRRISPHSLRSSYNARSPDCHGSVRITPSSGSQPWGAGVAVATPPGASLGVGTGEDLRPASATHCLGNPFDFLICQRGKLLR